MSNVLTSFFRRFSVASDVFLLFLNLALGQKLRAKPDTGSVGR